MIPARQERSSGLHTGISTTSQLVLSPPRGQPAPSSQQRSTSGSNEALGQYPTSTASLHSASSDFLLPPRTLCPQRPTRGRSSARPFAENAAHQLSSEPNQQADSESWHGPEHRAPLV